MPIFIQKHNELKLQEQGQSAEEDDPYNKTFYMLGTIKVPISLKLIGQNLPKSQYDEDKKKDKLKKNSNHKLQQIQEEENDEQPILSN